MSFEEELENVREHAEIGIYELNSGEEANIKIKRVWKCLDNCLDKQKVINAIEELASHGEGCRCPVLFNIYARNKLMNVLGLE